MEKDSMGGPDDPRVTIHHNILWYIMIISCTSTIHNAFFDQSDPISKSLFKPPQLHWLEIGCTTGSRPLFIQTAHWANGWGKEQNSATSIQLLVPLDGRHGQLANGYFMLFYFISCEFQSVSQFELLSTSWHFMTQKDEATDSGAKKHDTIFAS